MYILGGYTIQDLFNSYITPNPISQPNICTVGIELEGNEYCVYIWKHIHYTYIIYRRSDYAFYCNYSILCYIYYYMLCNLLYITKKNSLSQFIHCPFANEFQSTECNGYLCLNNLLVVYSM